MVVKQELQVTNLAESLDEPSRKLAIANIE